MKGIALERRSEGRRAPIAKRLSWKHVIVAIDDEGRPAGSAPPRSVDDGVPSCPDYTNVIEAYSAQMLCQPGGASLYVVGSLRLRAYAGKSKEFCQFRNKPFAAFMSVAECARRIHGSPHRIAMVPAPAPSVIQPADAVIAVGVDIRVDGIFEPEQHGGNAEDRPIPVAPLRPGVEAALSSRVTSRKIPSCAGDRRWADGRQWSRKIIEWQNWPRFLNG